MEFFSIELPPARVALAQMRKPFKLRGVAVELVFRANCSRYSRTSAAERFWEGIRSGIAAVEIMGAADMDSAWEIGTSCRGQDFPIVDRTSFAVMRRLGIERAASLDDHLRSFASDQTAAWPLRLSANA